MFKYTFSSNCSELFSNQPVISSMIDNTNLSITVTSYLNFVFCLIIKQNKNHQVEYIQL